MPPESQHDQVTAVVLECVECGAHDERAKGWQAYLSPDRGLFFYGAGGGHRFWGSLPCCRGGGGAPAARPAAERRCRH